MLEIRDLHVRYGGIQAVQGVNLSIRRGSIVTLVGANGAGKSSIIRSIAGLNKTISGEMLFTRREGDTPVSLMGLKPEDMVRRGISLSPEGRRILPHLTVEENLLLGAYACATAGSISAVTPSSPRRIVNPSSFIQFSMAFSPSSAICSSLFPDGSTSHTWMANASVQFL